MYDKQLNSGVDVTPEINIVIYIMTVFLRNEKFR